MVEIMVISACPEGKDMLERPWEIYELKKKKLDQVDKEAMMGHSVP
jgi:hypothetical protein